MKKLAIGLFLALVALASAASNFASRNKVSNSEQSSQGH